MVPRFRAFLTETKTIHDVLQIDLSRSMVSLKIENASEWYWFKEVVLMQSTGLKDKNGVEIYEGDIVQSTWYDVDNNPYKKKGEITFVGAQYVIVYDSQFDVETGEITYDAHSLTYAEDAEVIGNIYENPELLEQAHEN